MSSIAAGAPLPLCKPRLRGVSHQIAAFVAAAAGVALLAAAPSPQARLACGVYALSLCGLFSISAVYHRVHWHAPRSRQRMRRLDHAAIYGLIAGTYPPICVLALPPPAGSSLLRLIWAGAALGMGKTLLWPRAPKPLSALIYVILGLAVVPYANIFGQALGPQGMGAVLAGGLLYCIGSVVYALRRPNPAPQLFGYHEIFHLLVIAAAACHYAAVYQLVQRL